MSQIAALRATAGKRVAKKIGVRKPEKPVGPPRRRGRPAGSKNKKTLAAAPPPLPGCPSPAAAPVARIKRHRAARKIAEGLWEVSEETLTALTALAALTRSSALALPLSSCCCH
jgi:hypothetical protein